MITLIIVGVFVLVVLYMTYPRFQRRQLSAARFFRDLPPPRHGQSRLRRGKLQLTLPFFMQLFVLLFLLAALFLAGKKLSGDKTKGLGVWFIVDTSASMSTLQQEETRMDAAVREVEAAAEQARKAAGDRELCFRLSALDLERRDLLTQGNADAFAVSQAVKNLAPRPLGTDLGIIRRLLQLLTDQSREQCRVSHLVVVTDMPAPGWLGENRDIMIVWRDIGRPANNLGFTAIRASRNPLTGLVSEVKVEVTAYGTAPTNARFQVTGPDGSDVKDEVFNRWRGRARQSGFTPSGPGQYRLRLSPGGAYAFDDTAVVEIGDGRVLRVDWQLRNHRLPRLMGWSEDSVDPHFRVTADRTGKTDIPTLIVGPGYAGRSRPGSDSVIRDFMETSPLLEDLNLDAVELLGLRGIELPEGFQPVLRGMDGTVWLAQAGEPARAIVPGLPTGTDDVKGRVSAAVFFNAVRWLLQKRDLPPLYTLTAPHAPEPTANRLALHKDEGNTQRQPHSSGRLQDLKPVTGKGTAAPLWPILLMIAAILFLLERTIAAFN